MGIFGGMTWEKSKTAGYKWVRQVDFDKFWNILETTIEEENDGTLDSLLDALDEAFEEFEFLSDSPSGFDAEFQDGIEEGLERFRGQIERVKKKIKDGWDGETWEIVSKIQDLWDDVTLKRSKTEIQPLAQIYCGYSSKDLYVLTPNIVGVRHSNTAGETNSHLSIVNDLRGITGDRDFAVECLNNMDTPKWHMDTSLCTFSGHLSNSTCVVLSQTIDPVSRERFHSTMNRLAPKREFTQAEIDEFLSDKDFLV